VAYADVGEVAHCLGHALIALRPQRRQFLDVEGVSLRPPVDLQSLASVEGTETGELLRHLSLVQRIQVQSRHAGEAEELAEPGAYGRGSGEFVGSVGEHHE
jgi:hypothetical protein